MPVNTKLKNYTRDTYKVDQINDFKLDCSLGYNPFVDFKYIEKSIYSNFKIDELIKYPNDKVYTELKDSIKEFLEIKSLSVNNIFLGHGAFGVMERVIHKLCNHRLMLGVGPQFNEVPSEFCSTGGEYKTINFLKSANYLDEIINELHGKKYDVFYLDNPNNPTGYVFGEKEIRKIAAACVKNEVLFLVDEAYGDYLLPINSSAKLTLEFDNIIVVRSFSKGFGMAGIRSGYGIFSSNLATYYKQICPPFEPSLMSALISIQLLKNKQILNESREKSKDIKNYLTEKLTNHYEISLTDESVPMMLLHLKNNNLYKTFKDVGIITVNGESFKNTCDYFDNSYIRIRIPGSLKEAKLLLSLINIQI